MSTKKIEVSFTTTVPADVTEEELIEWLRYNLAGSSCSVENPMVDRDIEADLLSIEVK
ncbi:TPA: hypothetical protein OUK43_000388 [Pseudomonas aeruginosa]|nr:hypothetical protein [Pseudomonas aeruginosa]